MSKKRPRCTSVFLGRWTGDTYQCGLHSGHLGDHREGGTDYPIVWTDSEAWES